MGIDVLSGERDADAISIITYQVPYAPLEGLPAATREVVDYNLSRMTEPDFDTERVYHPYEYETSEYAGDVYALGNMHAVVSVQNGRFVHFGHTLAHDGHASDGGAEPAPQAGTQLREQQYAEVWLTPGLRTMQPEGVETIFKETLILNVAAVDTCELPAQAIDAMIGALALYNLDHTKSW